MSSIMNARKTEKKIVLKWGRSGTSIWRRLGCNVMNATEDSSSCRSRPTPCQKQALDQYFDIMQKKLAIYAAALIGLQDARDLVNEAYIGIWATMRNNPQMITIDEPYGFGVIKHLAYRQLKGRRQTVSLV